MARKRSYHRRYKNKYCSNFDDIYPQIIPFRPRDAIGGYDSSNVDLVTNPAQSRSAASAIVKVKNMEVTLTAECAINQYENIENVQYYILYIPQGFTPEPDTPLQHPEWIMAYKYLGNPDVENTQNQGVHTRAVKVKTRLARNLNTGDRVILMVRAMNTHASQNANIQIGGVVKWVTKFN